MENDLTEEQQEHEQEGDVDQQRLPLKNFVKVDFFGLESGAVGKNNHHNQWLGWETTLKLAFQSIGVVYGDLGTSPLYTLPGIFPKGVAHKDDLSGVLSLIIYSIFMITLIKYVFIVLSANDNGEGGTFALYSLICRYAKVSLIPNQEAEDREVSNYQLKLPNGQRLKRTTKLKSMLENSKVAKYLLLLITMLGTSMSCQQLGGIKEATSALTGNMIMWLSVVILILLFQLQRFGTSKVGYIFAPVLTMWFLFIGIIGIYNLVKYYATVQEAFNPVYIVKYFRRNTKDAWISLGGVILGLTGSEALFADLGHFCVWLIQISTCTLVFPSIVLAYMGQVSYLWEHLQDGPTAFYSSIPKLVYWPMFVIAVMAAIIASQSLISASFYIIQQSVALGCFPRVKIVHTSSKYGGQIYVP
ncbi:hypothetical protein RJ639_027457 [Escallonia herrerae]|uniref:K+ potassium transporter integral membrane domain-containing protein n=1 Tax=Escallonia herrerae TaxID=1293975 RepID=A0AA89BJJ7_9ASTE|nr:hypothetical protein RJ639_027457 [Escallonia herrerae]